MSILQILSLDKELITYRKELRQITGSVTASILLQQIVYWDNKMNGEFYKFIEPPKSENKFYKKGDSWTEELGFSKKEFQTAFAKLENLGLVSKKTDKNRTTFYALNVQKVEKKLEGVYSKKQGSVAKCQKERSYVPFGNLGTPAMERTSITETTSETTSKNKQKVELPKNLNLEAWAEWLKFKGVKYTAQQQRLAIAKLDKHSQKEQQEMVENSILSGYKGLFSPKKQTNFTKKRTVGEKNAEFLDKFYGDFGSAGQGEFIEIEEVCDAR
jgi:hypothetical protein